MQESKILNSDESANKEIPFRSQFTSRDILCGRGKTLFEHEGTKRFRMLIAKNMDAYVCAHGRTEKTKLVRKLTDDILEEGLVFWKKNGNNNKVWCKLSLTEAREKVGHTLRDSADGRIKCMKHVQRRIKKEEELQLLTMQIFKELLSEDAILQASSTDNTQMAASTNQFEAFDEMQVEDQQQSFDIQYESNVPEYMKQINPYPVDLCPLNITFEAQPTSAWQTLPKHDKMLDDLSLHELDSLLLCIERI